MTDEEKMALHGIESAIDGGVAPNGWEDWLNVLEVGLIQRDKLLAQLKALESETTAYAVARVPPGGIRREEADIIEALAKARIAIAEAEGREP